MFNPLSRGKTFEKQFEFPTPLNELFTILYALRSKASASSAAARPSASARTTRLCPRAQVASAEQFPAQVM